MPLVYIFLCIGGRAFVWLVYRWVCICVAYAWCVVWHEYGVFLTCIRDACIWRVGHCGCLRRAVETTAITGGQGCLRDHMLTNLFCSTWAVTVPCGLLLSSKNDMVRVPQTGRCSHRAEGVELAWGSAMTKLNQAGDGRMGYWVLWQAGTSAARTWKTHQGE